MKKLILILTTIVVSLPPLTAAAPEYYMWVDENGVTNFSQRNPEGVDATHISENQSFSQRAAASQRANSEPATPAAASASNSNAPASSEDNADPDALVNEQAAAMAAEMAAVKRKNCEIGKNNLAQIKAFARLRVRGEDGETRILTDEEKAAKAEAARQIIRENCSG
jgi:hypothetical protein